MDLYSYIDNFLYQVEKEVKEKQVNGTNKPGTR